MYSQTGGSLSDPLSIITNTWTIILRRGYGDSGAKLSKLEPYFYDSKSPT